MIHFDYGANSANFRVNKNALIPTNLGNTVGLQPTVLHNTIFLSPDLQCKEAYQKWLDTIVTSLKAVANKQVNLDPQWISGYLQVCALVDIGLAEAKRDLTMVNFTNPLSTNPLRDYWGPTYQTVVNAAIEDGPKYWSRWNALAQRMAEQYPHLDAPYFAQFRQLLGLGFADSASDRARYLFYHLFNSSFRAVASGSSGVTIDPMAALTQAEDTLNQFEATIAANATGFTADALAEIKSLILNAYGSAAAVDYGVVIDYTTKPIITYDKDLVNMLNNAVTIPNYIVNANEATQLVDSVPLISSWGAAAATGLQELISVESAYVVPNINESFAARVVDAYNAIATLPLTLFGPDFDGAAGLYNTSMIQKWYANYVSATSTLVFDCDSHFGVTQGAWFHVRPVAGRVNEYAWEVLPTGVIDIGSNSAMNAALMRTLVRAAATFNQFDFGNVYYYRASSDGQLYYYVLAEPVDEYALISRESLSTYTESAVVGLFDTSTTSFRTTRTGKYVVHDNTSSVKMGSSDSDTRHKGRRYGKRNKKKE